MKISKPNFFKSPLEHYKDAISKLMQLEPEILREKSVKPKLPFVYNLVYKDAQKPHITAFTFGLSSLDLQSTEKKKEICIQMNSSNLQWALVAAYLVNQLRGDCKFNEGEIIKFGQQIEAESNLNAFVVINCLIPNAQQYLLEGRKTSNIQIMQLVPIYEQEITSIAQLGLNAFIQKLQAELHNPKRDLLKF
ncbi:suppressor of fused domain protein [Sphingobacterium sp. HJSM2_6]|uniref:suppressor of fused domain protein n=1 Tax=Sphingobacterium sp. HJSM2_6 TaxID=3366264 RepID=UPI003BE3A3D2